MSHADETIICPNCNSEASGNYCSQCGQETHLHKETFAGLVAHFFAHYFHYDSKFWKTLKTLWFSPGTLTKAYWNKQRMRYIPPISLYIFVSAIYFLVSFSQSDNDGLKITRDDSSSTVRKALSLSNSANVEHLTDAQLEVLDSLYKDKNAKLTEKERKAIRRAILTDTAVQRQMTAPSSNNAIAKFLSKKKKKFAEKYSDNPDALNEKTAHAMPKIFFFMIPVMAFILKVRFFKRKDLFFVDHTIFALHYHTLWFSVFVLRFIKINGLAGVVLMASLVAAVMVYMAIALRRVYNISRFRAILSTFTLGLCYVIFLGVCYYVVQELFVLMA